jgi:RND family efflux transporter MFP subunit
MRTRLVCIDQGQAGHRIGSILGHHGPLSVQGATSKNAGFISAVLAMGDPESKLEELRIDRRASLSRARNRGFRWTVVSGAALLMIGVGVWTFALGTGGIRVHAAVAKAASVNGIPAGAGGSLLDASGYVVARRQATVSAKAIYKVVEVLVDEGDHVNEGQIIARLDDSNTRAILEQATAAVTQAEAHLAAAELAASDARPIFERSQRQVAVGLISMETFDTAKATYDAAVTALNVERQNLGTAQKALAVAQSYENDTTIRAPFTGVVTSVSAQPGQLVSTQFASGGGIATVVDMNSLEVQVDVSESFINRVHAGQGALITLNAYPDWHIPAQVIAIIPTADQTKATVKVRVAFKQKDNRVLPEMGASVSFLLDDDKGSGRANPVSQSVIVPVEAVQGSGDSGTVFLIEGNTVHRQVVKLGARITDGQTVLSGLRSGDRVAIGELGKLTDGAKIYVEE